MIDELRQEVAAGSDLTCGRKATGGWSLADERRVTVRMGLIDELEVIDELGYDDWVSRGGDSPSSELSAILQTGSAEILSLISSSLTSGWRLLICCLSDLESQDWETSVLTQQWSTVVWCLTRWDLYEDSVQKLSGPRNLTSHKHWGSSYAVSCCGRPTSLLRWTTYYTQRKNVQ